MVLAGRTLPPAPGASRMAALRALHPDRKRADIAKKMATVQRGNCHPLQYLDAVYARPPSTGALRSHGRHAREQIQIGIPSQRQTSGQARSPAFASAADHLMVL